MMNSIQRATAVKVILGVLVATLAIAGAANAQASFTGKFLLTSDTQWNHTVLPAGEYYIEMSSVYGPIVVKSVSTGKQMITGIPIKGDAKGSTSQLTITVFGNQRKVRALNLPQKGLSLVFDPMTNAEKEMLAQGGHIESIPVLTAQK